jgi:drug/metabolite transporter (DMT)-like permease
MAKNPVHVYTTPTSSFWPSAVWEGAFWKIISCACFAGINGIVRYCSGGVTNSGMEPLPVNVIMFFQNVFGTLFLLPWILKPGFKNLATHHPILHLIRIITAVAGIYLWYLSLQFMPITEAVALNFTGPIFTVIGASLLLKEKISLQRSYAIILSFIGAFMISRPDLPLYGGSHPIGLTALLPLSSAVAFALNKLLTRKLANLGETPISLALYLLLLMTPVSLLPALYEWATPNLVHWPWLVSLGLLAAGAHLSFSKAYQLAEVTFLAPIGSIKFFLSALVGYVAFSELPTTWSSWVGISIIFISISLLSYKISLYSCAKRFKSNWFKNNE